MTQKKLIFILGNLTAFGPFVTDFYLPCLPTLTSYFATSASVVQTSLTAGMVGLAAGQLIIGPLTDKYGRKQPLLCCLLLFLLATVGCMFSTHMVPFVAFRLLQGLTGAGGLVISKAVIADSFSDADLSKSFALLAAIQGAAPIVAPVLGGVAFSLTSWQGAFAVLALWGFVLWTACRRLSETLPPGERLDIPVWKSFRCYLTVAGNRRYLQMNLLQGFASATLMAYISASPFIFQEHFGLTPMQYGLCFAGNALALVIGSAAIMKTNRLAGAARWGSLTLLLTALCTSASLWWSWPFALFEVPLFLLLFCVGVLTPVAITLALQTVGEHRGMASALLGATPFLLGGLVAPLTGIGNLLHSTVFVLLACSLLCTLFGLYEEMRRKHGNRP